MLRKIAEELLKSRIDFIEEMYLRFIQEESKERTHPMDFKNFIIWELQKEIKKI